MKCEGENIEAHGLYCENKLDCKIYNDERCEEYALEELENQE